MLVVDDDPVIRELLRMNLELDGHEVVEAADGRGALDAVERERPDVLVLDVVMPAPDGFEVCARLREAPATVGLAIVLLAACATRPERATGQQVGADAYVTKPFDPIELVALVEGLAARATPEPPCPA